MNKQFCYSTLIGFFTDLEHNLTTNIFNIYDNKKNDIYMNYSKSKVLLRNCLLVYESSEYEYDNMLFFQILRDYNKAMIDVIVDYYNNSQLTLEEIKNCFFNKYTNKTYPLFDKLIHTSTSENIDLTKCDEINENFLQFLDGCISSNNEKIDCLEECLMEYTKEFYTLCGIKFFY